MKSFLALAALVLSVQSMASTYQGSSFREVWDQVTSDEYSRLPQYEISYGSLSSWTKNFIKDAAKRTLNKKDDVIPEFTKLAHPNGICLKGVWKIDTKNEYTGQFKQGTEALIVARASTAMSETKVGDNRAFGFAGKIFPTMNEDSLDKVQTANFFLVDDLGGTKAKHYTDVKLTNEPEVSKTSTVLKNILYVLKLARTFAGADSNPGMRQVYEISELGKTKEEVAITPKWMEFRAANGQTIDEADFRDELNVDNYNGELVFEIRVANSENSRGVKNWTKIGTVTFSESVVSKSCDKRLHFHHPQWKKDLKHSHYEAYKTYYDQQAYEAQRRFEDAMRNW